MSQYIDADPDWEIWLAAPGPPEIDPQPIDVRTWSEQFADAVFNDAGLTPDHNDRERLVRMLELAGDRAYPRHTPWVAKWVHLPTWDEVPLAVVLDLYQPADIDQPDPTEALRALVGCGDPGVVEEPRVERITTPLGAAVRALSYTNSAGELNATLSWAWAVTMDGDPLYARLWAAWDPARIIAAAPDIDALARTLHLATE